MHAQFVRRRMLTLVALTGSTILAGACTDKRVKELDTGITRDSVMSVISHDLAPTARSDSFPNVYSRERFLIAGKNYEVLYFAPNNAKADKDTIPLKNLTPLVLVDNKLVTKGWDGWDSVAKANNIPIKKR